MEQERAQRVVARLRERNVFAHVKLPLAGLTRYGIRVVLPDGREAIWDNDGTAGLEAQVMRNGILVGFVPVIEGSEHFDEEQVVDAIVHTDYAPPVARRRTTPPPPAAPLPPHGGVFRRFLDGFRDH